MIINDPDAVAWLEAEWEGVIDARTQLRTLSRKIRDGDQEAHAEFQRRRPELVSALGPLRFQDYMVIRPMFELIDDLSDPGNATAAWPEPNADEMLW